MAPYLKSLRYGKYESRGQRCSSTLKVCQDVLKNVNLLHKLAKKSFLCKAPYAEDGKQPPCPVIKKPMTYFTLNQQYTRMSLFHGVKMFLISKLTFQSCFLLLQTYSLVSVKDKVCLLQSFAVFHSLLLSFAVFLKGFCSPIIHVLCYAFHVLW